MLPTFRRGIQQAGGLSLDDVPLLEEDTLPIKVASTFISQGGINAMYVSTKGLKLWPTVLYFIKRDIQLFTTLGLAQGVSQLSLALVPYFIELLLVSLDEESKSVVSSQPASNYYGMYLVGALVGCFTLNFLAYPAANYLGVLMGSRASTVLLTLVGCKSPLVSKDHRVSGEAQIVLSRGINAFSTLFTALHLNTWAPLMSLVISALSLVRLLGAVAAFSSLALMALLVISSSSLRVFMRRYERRSTNIAGERYGLLGEALDGAEGVKALGIENWVASRIESIRTVEVSLLRVSILSRVVVDALMASVLPLSILTAFLVFDAVHGGVPPTPSQAFSAVTWITFCSAPLASFGSFLSTVTDADINLGRVRKFMGLPEASTSHLWSWGRPNGNPKEGISEALLNVESNLLRALKRSAGIKPIEEGFITDMGSLALLKVNSDVRISTEASALKPYSFATHKSGLTLIAGPTGSGKSTLLGNILGDSTVWFGKAVVNAPSFFVPQDPWIQKGSVRENICLLTHGKEHSVDLLDQVLTACALNIDLTLGLESDCGEGGSSLSGGQRARVALARAVYSGLLSGRPSLFLFDDFLSSLDVIMRGALWRDCIVDLLLSRGHGVVLVTHTCIPEEHYHWIENTLILRHGGQGIVVQGVMSQERVVLPPQSILSTTLSSIPPPPFSPTIKLDKQVVPGFQSIASYAGAMGRLNCLSLLLLFFGAQSISVVQSFWLKIWANNEAAKFTFVSPAAFYCLLALTYVVCYTGGLVVLTHCTLFASTAMHNAALKGVLNCSLPCLEGLGRGAVLARFEGDVDHLDLWIRPNILYVLNAIAAAGSVCTVAALTAPLLLAWVAALGVGYYAMGVVYKRVVFSLRALDATTASGLTGKWREFASQGGASVLRTSGPLPCASTVISLLVAQTPKLTSSLASTAGAALAGNLIFSVGSSILVVVALLSFILCKKGELSVGSAGLLLSAAYAFPNAMKNLVINLGWLEVSAVSIARLHEYSNLGCEDKEDVKKVLPELSTIPSFIQTPSTKGFLAEEVKLVDVWVAKPDRKSSYVKEGNSDDNSPRSKNYGIDRTPLLDNFDTDECATEWMFKGISFTIPAGAKVAIVGSSGSGKSALLKTLLRLWPQTKGGSIFVGGCNLALLASVSKIKRLFSVVPQGGLVFSGSIRDNLLFGNAIDRDEVEDETLIDICRYVSPTLVDKIQACGGLSSNISPKDSGSQMRGSAFPVWSAGEKMLLSLARVLVKQNGRQASGVILLDEVSSDLDSSVLPLTKLFTRTETMLVVEHSERNVTKLVGYTHTLRITSKEREGVGILLQELE
jgi:ABC-type multidrug transport system fused ATPase/permease subunit